MSKVYDTATESFTIPVEAALLSVAVALFCTVLGMSGVTGAALRETSLINRSLSALADVLGAIAEQRSHVPYRNSKLTHLLQDSVGKRLFWLPLNDIDFPIFPLLCCVKLEDDFVLLPSMWASVQSLWLWSSVSTQWELWTPPEFD